MGDASNETEWAADRKVGFAMGILLIGVVAALFFRNEPLAITDTPTVARGELIDSRLRDRNVEVYVDESESQGTPTSEIWANSEFLEDYRQHDPGVALPIAPLTSGPSPSQESTPTPHQRLDIRPPVIEQPSESPKTVPAESAGGLELTELPASTSLAPPAEQFEEYTIQYGDTLSGIAEKKLGSPARYTDIYNANKDRMASPDRLRVGAAIRIPRH
jgi:hypothetical protein